MAQKCCFMGRGKVYLAKYDKACSLNKDLYPLLEIGNSSGFALNATVNTVNGPKNYRTASSVSECAPIESIETVTLTMDVHCLSVANFAKAYAASTGTVAAGTTVAQTMLFTVKGQTIPFRGADGKAITNVTNVVGEPSTGAGTDFVISANGITIPETSTIALPATMSITFDHGAYDLVQLLTSTGDEYRIYFDGINVAENPNSPFSGELFRVKLKPTGLPALMGDEFTKWSFEGTVLADACQVASPTNSVYGTFGF